METTAAPVPSSSTSTAAAVAQPPADGHLAEDVEPVRSSPHFLSIGTSFLTYNRTMAMRTLPTVATAVVSIPTPRQ